MPRNTVRYNHDQILTLIAEIINDLTPQQAFRVHLALFPEEQITMRLTANDAIYTVTYQQEKV